MRKLLTVLTLNGERGGGPFTEPGIFAGSNLSRTLAITNAWCTRTSARMT